MHALRHVHQLVIPGGTVVEMHPVTQEEIERVGVILEPEWLTVDLPNSEAALRQTITEGLYGLEAETHYDVLSHFDNAEELIDARRDLLADQPELVEAIRAAPAPLVTRMRIVFRRLSLR